MGLRGLRRTWRQPRLALKLALLIVGVSLMGVTASFLLGTTVHRGQLVDAARQSAERLSLTVRASLEDAMIRNDRAAMASIIGEMGEAGVVSRAWLLDGDGLVYVGTTPEQTGSLWPATREFRGSFARADALDPRDLQAVVTEHDTLLSLRTLENDPQCQECHGTDETVLGYLILELPMNDLRGQLAAALRPMAMATVFALLLLVGLLVAGVHRLVVRPVEELGDAAARAATGDLDHPITVTASDEFQDLAGAFEHMRSSLKTTMAGKDRRNRELSDLNRLAISAAEVSSPQEIAHLGLQALAKHLGVRAAAVYLAHRDGLTLAASIGIPDGQLPLLEQAARTSTMRRQVVGQGGRLLWGLPSSSDLTAAPNGIMGERCRVEEGCLLRRALGENQAGNCVCLPLLSHDVTVGLMEMTLPGEEAVSFEQVDFLNLLAHGMGVAIHNLRLLASTREMATLEERDRVAREMHDRLAQDLAYLKLRASVAAEAARSGRLSNALEGLDEIKGIAGDAYRETREAIFHLRASTRTDEDGLVPILRAFAADCARRYGLEVTVEALDDWEGKVLSPDMETQLLLAVQEAVFNACRHAHASRVVVTLGSAPDGLQVRVTDDGSGFDPSSTHPPDRYGLRIMQERVEGVGGGMEIRSTVGAGTEVRFTLHEH